MSLSGVVVACHSLIGHKGGFIKGDDRYWSGGGRGRVRPRGQIAMSAGTNGNAARSQAESHPVMNRRVFSVCRLPDRERRSSRIEGTIDTRYRSLVSRHPVTRDRPALPEMRYRDRSALSKIGQLYPIERSMGSMGSLFRALSLSLFFSFSLIHTVRYFHTFQTRRWECCLLWHILMFVFSLSHNIHSHTYTHILSLALPLPLSRDELMPTSRWLETSMLELVPILKRSNPLLPPSPPRDDAAAAVAAALLEVTHQSTLPAPRFTARVSGAIPPA